MPLTRRALCFSVLSLAVAPAFAAAKPKRLIEMNGRVRGKPVRGALFDTGAEGIYRFVLYGKKKARYVDLRPRPADLSRHALLAQSGRYRFTIEDSVVEMVADGDGIFRLRSPKEGETGGGTTAKFAVAAGVLWAGGGLAFAGLGIAGLALLTYNETGKTPTELLEDVTNAITDAIDTGDVPTSYGED